MKIAKPISIIKLKDHQELKVKRSTGEIIQHELSTATQHLFIKINELGRTINSAEIKEVVDTVEVDSVIDSEYITTPEQRKIAGKRIKEIAEEMRVKGIFPTNE